MDLCILLREYDICNLHQRKRIGENGRKQQREPQRKTLSNRVDERGLIELMPALLEIWSLRGQKGKWTGTKAIKVLRLIYEDNVPPFILDILRTQLQNMHKMLLSFAKGEAPTGGSPEIEDRVSVEDSLRKSNDDREAALDSKVGSRGTPRPPPHGGASRIAQPVHHEPNATVDDVFCLTCNGRGCRNGTGRLCEYCRGTGGSPVGRSMMMTIAKHKGQADTKCRACNGTGNIFSERDRCRACNDGYERPGKRDSQPLHRERETTKNRRAVADGERREGVQEGFSPPPPYSGPP